MRTSAWVVFNLVALFALVLATVLNLADRSRASKLRIALQTTREEYEAHSDRHAKLMMGKDTALNDKHRQYIEAMSELKELRISERDATTQLKHVKDELENTKKYAHVLSWKVEAWPNASIVFALASRARRLHARLSEMLKIAAVKGNERFAQLLSKPLSEAWPIDTEILSWSGEKWRLQEDFKELRAELRESFSVIDVPTHSVSIPNEMSSDEALVMLQRTVDSLRGDAAKRLESSESSTISDAKNSLASQGLSVGGHQLPHGILGDFVKIRFVSARYGSDVFSADSLKYLQDALSNPANRTPDGVVSIGTGDYLSGGKDMHFAVEKTLRFTVSAELHGGKPLTIKPADRLMAPVQQ
jgi:hypothetical protein